MFICMNVYCMLKCSHQIQDINFEGCSVQHRTPGVIIVNVCPQVFFTFKYFLTVCAQAIVIYLNAFPQRSHLNVYSQYRIVFCTGAMLRSGHCRIFETFSTKITLERVESVSYRVVHRCYVALRQAGNWWKWQFLHGAQIINGQFLVPCYSLPMTMCSLLLPCMTALSLPGQLFYPI